MVSARIGFRQNQISSERGPQEEQNDVKFSFHSVRKCSLSGRMLVPTSDRLEGGGGRGEGLCW